MSDTQQTSAPQDDTGAWESDVAERGAREGFYREIGPQHSALFTRRGPTLVVTFENLDHVKDRIENQLPWGYAFTEANGWSMLGLMAHDWTWYRDEHVFDFFEELRDSGFFAQFDRVIFYGASMGAYAACTFSGLVPGCDVVAISPQATLDRDIASWEWRYRRSWRLDFSGRYSFAPDQVTTARRVVLFYDPAAPQDAMHAALFRGDNILKIRCRYMGHRIMSLWAAMGVLKPIVNVAMREDPDPAEIYALMRARRTTSRYLREMLERLQELGHDDLVVRLCRHVLKEGRAPRFRAALREARNRIKKTGRTRRRLTLNKPPKIPR